MTAKTEADLVSLLELKRQMITDLLNALRQSKEHLNNGDAQAFDAEMNKIEDLPEALEKLSQAEAELRRFLPDAARSGRVAELDKDIDYIRGEAGRAYQDCKNAAHEKMQEYGQQIKSLRNTQKGIKGYAGQRQTQAVFVDQRK